jgi:AcrR family transcriptional regulator
VSTEKRSDRSGYRYTAQVPTATADRTLRSDARRNRERLVACARELFASEGVDVPVDEITRRAGLGMGTLYRHFPTKDELVDAVLEDAFGELVGAAEQAAVEPDAWAGFMSFLEHALALHAANRGLKDVMATRVPERRRAEAMRARIRPLLRVMIARAHEQGTLRTDFTVTDLPLLFWTCDRVIDATADVAPDYWRRYLSLVLDGLRAEAATPLPRPPLTDAQLARAAKRRHG